MSFTTVTAPLAAQGQSQFVNIPYELWGCSLLVNPASIAASAEGSANFTIQNLELGDIVLGFMAEEGLSKDAEASIHVSADNTLTIRVSNLSDSRASDHVSSMWEVSIARPIR